MVAENTSEKKRTERLVLITGATGYVGSCLLKRLESLGVTVRCLTRRLEVLRSQVRRETQVVAGDVLEAASLMPALQGVDTAYYLVHSMGSPGKFEEKDRLAANNFATAARTAGVRRIIYLGGLGDESEHLSPHLRSRHEVGKILRSSGVTVIEFRASIILGAGSLSFEMIRSLVDRLPIMVTPRWVRVPAQPIAIDDVLSYLIAALEHPVTESRIYEIGGPECVSYADLMKEYARQCGLRRLIIPVPVLTPYLSSLWLALVTPLYARVGRALVESIRHPTVVRDDSARREFLIEPMGYREAMAAAIAAKNCKKNDDRILAVTHHNEPGAAGGNKSNRMPETGRCLIDARTVEVPVPPEAAFAPIRRIGGAAGWYYANALWHLRGAIDVLCGGVGMRRGRRDPELLAPGDTVDAWRVEAFEPDRRLLLRAEMKLPGRAWLEFNVEPTPAGSCVRQTATFEPSGLVGHLYWYLLYPFHQLIFAGMLRRIAELGQSGSMQKGPAYHCSVLGQLGMLLVWLSITLGTGAIGSALTATSVRDWYPTLNKPAWTPPDWLFGPVWTALYVMMGVAAWLVWRRTGWVAGQTALGIFAVQLLLNVAWSAFFFTLRSPAIALVDILFLWLAIVAMIWSFTRVSTVAASLLIPYLLWVSYAAVLNAAIWRMNR